MRQPPGAFPSPDLKDGKVKLDDENVVEFPNLPEMQQVTLEVLRWENGTSA